MLLKRLLLTTVGTTTMAIGVAACSASAPETSTETSSSVGATATSTLVSEPTAATATPSPVGEPTDDDQVRDLVARFVNAINAGDVDGVMATETMCGSSPSDAEELHRQLFAGMADTVKSEGPYRAQVDRVEISGDQGRVIVTARLEGSGTDASGGWGGPAGSPILRTPDGWRLCMG